ncbi:unnamed protein product [Acanthoscelides obtectus]|uniref:Uncharacterized protein n=1 Tax=Acanthoscelides obtectus TaxID=200917 RepID=A0A9P0LRC8_ACAOB|nr:unnamed protein product [Acanthoscelides obtectus]CAK1634936.1 hypothetical protein AOBTE_LOCUS8968 [Acanthoscelides obtectus]
MESTQNETVPRQDKDNSVDPPAIHIELNNRQLMCFQELRELCHNLIQIDAELTGVQLKGSEAAVIMKNANNSLRKSADSSTSERV